MAPSASTAPDRARPAASQSSPPSSTKAASLSAHIVPKRVPSTSSITDGSSADQKLVPAAVAPWRTMPASVAAAPAAAAASPTARAREAKRAAAWSPIAPDRRAGSHTATRNSAPPTSSAVAP